MKKVFALALGLLLAGTVSASAQDIKYNFDKQANFAGFKTYKWVPIKGAQPLNSIADKQVTAAIDAALAKKGLTKTESDTADLYIGYQAAVDTEKEYTSYTSGGAWGYGPGWYGAGWYGGGGLQTTTGQTRTIYVGQLAVDMYSTAAKALVWRGTATKTLDPKAKPEKQEKNLAKAMEKLFKNFPPPVDKKK
jgi:hypothetical protein